MEGERSLLHRPPQHVVLLLRSLGVERTAFSHESCYSALCCRFFLYTNRSIGLVVFCFCCARSPLSPALLMPCAVVPADVEGFFHTIQSIACAIVPGDVEGLFHIIQSSVGVVAPAGVEGPFHTTSPLLLLPLSGLCCAVSNCLACYARRYCFPTG